MKTKNLILMSSMVVLVSFGILWRSMASQIDESSSLEVIAEGKLRVLTLTGTPYERGFQHGSLLKKEIKIVTDSLLSDIQRTTQEEPLVFIDNFLKESEFAAAMQKWTPDLLEEVRGISEGSGLDYDLILMHQLGDEFFFNTHYLFAHQCSSIGINKNEHHPSIAAQNMDIPIYFHGYQTVMKIIEEGGNELLILTIPGHIGITGMNGSSVSINCNTLMQLKYQSKGLPVSAIVRGVLSKTNFNEAIEWVKKMDHASAQNYIIGGKECTRSLECSATDIEEFKPFEEATFTYHTNQPFENKSFSEHYLTAIEDIGFTLFEAKGFCQRIPSFEKRFNEETRDFGIAEIKEVLSSRDHDGFDVVSNSYTYASVIYVLSEQPQFIIAPGKPHETAYLELGF